MGRRPARHRCSRPAAREPVRERRRATCPAASLLPPNCIEPTVFRRESTKIDKRPRFRELRHAARRECPGPIATRASSLCDRRPPQRCAGRALSSREGARFRVRPLLLSAPRAPRGDPRARPLCEKETVAAPRAPGRPNEGHRVARERNAPCLGRTTVRCATEEIPCARRPSSPFRHGGPYVQRGGFVLLVSRSSLPANKRGSPQGRSNGSSCSLERLRVFSAAL
jgi:hypothetical protein